ncbi:MAG TPA: hypothetical protein VFZ12_01960 [Dehalococcoidia bacterium]|nr:hypothetical protein [Dehalococcoidia bacterium]
MQTRLNVIAGLGFFAYLASLAAGTFLLARLLGVGGDGIYFNVQRWETENALGHLMYELRTAVSGTPEGAEADGTIERYLQLNQAIVDLRSADAGASDESGQEQLELALDDRVALEGEVEAILEDRVAEAVRSLDLTEELPIFEDYSPVWPPVSAELGEPPRVLATSPRERIELLDSDLLRPDLTSAEVLDVEARHNDEELSAVVEDTGGVGTYPSNISHRTSYEDLLEVVAHEWTHQYLAFYPLGFNYFDSNELRTLNETVANVVGREVGERAAELYPLGGSEPDEPASVRTIDFRSTMRALRLEVDDLLAEGEIERAEQRMEEVRRELAEGGIFIRKINQAYFAFNGSYGDAPQSSSPIGPKIEDLRGSVPTLDEFLQLVRDVTSERELNAALDAAD